ncbi:MAG: hypothetical protein ACPL3A_10850 [Thermoanaerobacteraceae bacterium]
MCLILGFSSTVSFAALVYDININNKHIGLYYNIRGDQIYNINSKQPSNKRYNRRSKFFS